jgi:hypothetical protein
LSQERPVLERAGAFHVNLETIMKKQIATATVIGAMLAVACLLWEQQSVAASKGPATRALRTNPSPFDQHLRYCNVHGPEAEMAS